MSNERRGSGVRVIVYVLLAIWATTALLAIAIRTVHALTSIALSVAITAALVVFVLRAVAGVSRSNEEDH